MIRHMSKWRGVLTVAVALAGARLASADITISDDPSGIQNPVTGEEVQQ